MPESNLNVEMSRRIRKDIQGESALGERTIEVILIAIVRCKAVFHSLSVYQDSHRDSQTNSSSEANSPTVTASRHQDSHLARCQRC
jgi:hypothetical protein